MYEVNSLILGQLDLETNPRFANEKFELFDDSFI